MTFAGQDGARPGGEVFTPTTAASRSPQPRGLAVTRPNAEARQLSSSATPATARPASAIPARDQPQRVRQSQADARSPRRSVGSPRCPARPQAAGRAGLAGWHSAPHRVQPVALAREAHSAGAGRQLTISCRTRVEWKP